MRTFKIQMEIDPFFTRRELQQLAKQHGVRANAKSTEIFETLNSLGVFSPEIHEHAPSPKICGAPQKIFKQDRRVLQCVTNSRTPMGASNIRKSVGDRNNNGRGRYGAHCKDQFVDPRPIKTREFQIESGKKIMEFLVNNKYDLPITKEILMQPTSKDCQNIMAFLLKCLNRNHISTNLSEDVVSIYRGLK